MIAINENAWNEQDGLQNTPGDRSENDATFNSVRNSAVDPDEDEDDLDDEAFDDDDLDYDDDDFDEDDLDDADLDEDDDGYERVGGATTSSNEASGIEKSYDTENDGNETPEEEQAHREKESYNGRTDVEQQTNGDEASFSERNDVEPPTPHEFPGYGTHTEANFESRPLGRTTGRMIGHEPGTENI